MSVSIAGALVCSIISIVSFLPAYWNLELSEGPLKLPTGLTVDGHPWIGSDSERIVITEYSDYLCFQCKKMNFYLREFVFRHPDKIKLVHRHFPMDSRFNPSLNAPFHEGAGIMALIAIHAAENGKFWPVNDYLFSIAGHGARIDIKEIATKSGLNVSKIKEALNDPNIRQKLVRDIQQGLKFGLTGTPSYVIEDRVYHALLIGTAYRP
jgi:protein-disulfide isomerase